MSNTNNIFPNKDSKQLLMTLLKVMGGRMVNVGFSGSGDSGSIEDVSLLDTQDQPIDLTNATFPWPVQKSVWSEDKKEWVQTYETQDYPLEKILIEITENALEESGLDWYNNDGGQGMLAIDLTQDPPKIELNVGINYTRTEEHNFDYTEDEEDVAVDIKEQGEK